MASLIRGPSVPWNFLGLPPEQADVERAYFVVVPVPYDSTTSYKAGAREGPSALIAASRSLEDYDPALGWEPCSLGIATLPEVEPHVGDPAATIERVAETVDALVGKGKMPVLLGGEHSITLGGVQGALRHYPHLSVLYLDAHADLRDTYMGTPYSHACTARRIAEVARVVEVGVRSMSAEEARFARAQGIPLFPWTPTFRAQDALAWVLPRLGPDVYISVDLDVLDPAVMPAVGTPEPGGLSWGDLLVLLEGVARARRIVAFDVVELCPREGPAACAVVAAALVYKLMGLVALRYTPGR
ncbi:MAG: agmatinase [Dehalococcoidia bacterium]|nr:agmatinase [Dehalococcoidia bacterium]MDW8120189.1 agmatinase [Chloroflexota bacterium]